ncbi:aldo/keto reductase [Candidatus Borreliella tachyglossi]|uniref:aldo/keto reductase n=1 Tax=Candidatus Borreliella tachyglossi TaxID=1964448 RepID=UPI004040F03C
MNNLKEDLKKHSQLILGAWQFGGGYFKKVEEREVQKILRKAYDFGIKNIDTAKVYGHGISEKLIGEFISKDSIRENILLASKCYPMKIEEYKKNFQESLQNLRTDYIDIYYIHWPEEYASNLKPIAEFLEEMRHRGKIKYLGVSNFEIQHIESISDVCKIDINQIGYNPLFRNKEDTIIPYCKENNIAIISYSTLAQGLLARENIKNKTEFDAIRVEKLILFRKEIWPHTLKTLQNIKEIATQNNISTLELTYAWLKRINLDGFIVGFSKEHHIESNHNAFKQSISDNAYHKMTKILDDFKRYTIQFPNLFDKKI